METFGRKGDVRTAKHLNPDNINFSMFTTEDIRKLSVVKIHTHITFDALGHPLSGGLHDKCLGPLDDKTSEPCGTCLKNAYTCPGHYGYIELPLPTVNPLFHKIIATILKKSCLQCYHVLFPSHVRHSLQLQMKLLDAGYVSEAIEVENMVLELVSQHKHFDNIPEENLVPLQKFEELVTNTDKNTASMNKNTETIRNQFIANVFARVETKKHCPHCKASLIGVTSLKNRLMITVRHQLPPEKEKAKGSQIKAMQTKPVTPGESRNIFRKLWDNDQELLLQLVPVLRGVNTEYPTDVFYFDVIPVVPSNVRPVSILSGTISEHQQTRVYKTILQDCLVLRAAIKVHQTNDIESLTDEAKTVYMLARGSSALEKLHNCWELLQTDVNNLLDQEAKIGGEQGLKQIIEKKAGIIRMHMMGKRVNFAARSVITPDPNLNIDEIGIPEVFAKHLTYPVPVTLWNVEELRKLIQNGPNVHPGAVAVEINGRVVRINPNMKTQQESIFKQLLTPDESDKGFKGVKLVHRHLCNGDVLLLNRQPTLHKPSIMAHTARILKGEKTLRLHYANCKAYNADFDGDEMNAHFPQNELARSEGYTIANVSNQYLVPKDGTPLSGLIQDHMISGVRMSVRGKFFERHDYQQLVYQALSFQTSRIKLLKPAIMKPAVLWSGKQILSTVILNIIPKHRNPINLSAGSKIPAKAWQNAEVRDWKAGGTELHGNAMTEAEVIIRGGELLVGILDKTHYGATPYGLVHCMYELYGGTYAIKLLSSFAKLFTCFLQREGFTLGVHDILVLAEADKERSEIIKRSRVIGNSVMSKALNIAESDDCHHVLQHAEGQAATNPKLRTIVDRQYKSSIDSYTNEINKVCLPAGLVCKFPSNNLQLMVQSGAKGSTVNTMQISCLLGQIELEGKRPPIMISGRSLPSFPPFEFAPRAGGFIDGRFMTGIQPQEFFFHCMAGREGLIDTAVKTSRSGYLQRCLIKHLEGLSVGYDMTVRDSDKSVIQFAYGEDGMDISKAQFLNKTQMPFLVDNCKAIIDEKIIESLEGVDDYDRFLDYSKGLRGWKKRHAGEVKVEGHKTPFWYFSEQVSDRVNVEKPFKVNGKTGRGRKATFICDLWQQAEDAIKTPFLNQRDPRPDPAVAIYQADAFFGSINERLAALVDDFASESKREKKVIDKLVKMKSMQSLCAPGEPVGLLAAQSIGEPSTQMTLNTFHFAGRGEMNVTLGIPRLREILMMASKNLKTPSMEVPFLKVPKLEQRAEKLRKMLTRTVVADVLEKIDVTQELEMVPVRQHKIVLKFHFMPHKLYKDDYHVKPEKIIKYMSDTFFNLMFMAIRKYAKVNSSMVSMDENKSKKAAAKRDDDDDEDAGPAETAEAGAGDLSSDEDMPEDDEDAKLASKYNQNHDDQEPEEVDDEGEASDDENEKETTENHSESEAETSKPAMSEDQVNTIRSYVVDRHTLANNYTFDAKKFRWCELTFGLPLNFKKIDMTAILREVAAKAVLWETPGIKRAITYMNNDVLTLRTDGINLVEMFKYNTLLDLNKLYSNDIHKVAETYGIEAGMRVIVKEVRDVFNVYGITVDPRHLSLIADYMTYGGSFEPLSRKGMESSASPLQQMSFESSLAFLKSAAIRGKNDKLTNPSSCLMVGKPCNTGTGSFTLLQNMSPQLLAKT